MAAGCTAGVRAGTAGGACCLLLVVLRVVIWPSAPPLPASQLAALLAFKVSVAAGHTAVMDDSSAVTHAQSLNQATEI
jgi:hypothetical protein